MEERLSGFPSNYLFLKSSKENDRKEVCAGTLTIALLITELLILLGER